MSSLSKRVAERFKQARIRAGLSQEGVSRISGVSAITISRLERGVTKNPKTDELERIAKAVGTTVHDLVAEDDQSTSDDDMSMVEVQRKLAEITGDRRISISFLRAAQNRDRIPKSAWALIELALQAANESIPEQREDRQDTTE